MAVTESGKPKKSTLGGGLVFDEGNNQLTLMVAGVFSIIFGILPNGDPGFIIVKPGEDAFDVFD